MIGLLIGINIGLFRGFRGLMNPVVTFISMIPPLAILPILFITFGVGELGKVMLIFIGILPLITRDISIGDCVLTGGELAAMVMIDAISRLVPGVVGSMENVTQDSISSGLLQHPLYTRPAQFRDLGIPEILRSGHHAEIEKWRRRESLRRTLERRPDLLETAQLTPEDLEYLESLGFSRRNDPTEGHP